MLSQEWNEAEDECIGKIKLITNASKYIKHSVTNF